MNSHPSNEQESNLADRIAAGMLARAEGEAEHVATVDANESSQQQFSDTRIDSVQRVALDIDEFLRGWIGRLRQVVIRASQLAEQEEMLKSTLAAVDAQQAEWARQTEARERAIQQQTKMLTEAWLELEEQRREKLQHGGGTVARNAGQGFPQISLQPVASTTNSEWTNPGTNPPESTKQDAINTESAHISANQTPAFNNGPSAPDASVSESVVTQSRGGGNDVEAITLETSDASNATPIHPSSILASAPSSVDQPSAPARELAGSEHSARELAGSEHSAPEHSAPGLAPSPLAGLAANPTQNPCVANPSIMPVDPWKNQGAGGASPPTLSSSLENSAGAPIHGNAASPGNTSTPGSPVSPGSPSAPIEQINDGVSDAVKQFQRLRRDVRNTQNN